MDTEHLDFLFTSEALENHDIRVREITGREQIGRLYEFRVRFTVEAGPLGAADVDALLAKACSFTLGTCSEDVVHGIVREVDLVDAVEGFPAVYVATVVPSVWLLTLSRLSRVYQNVTVLDIAREIFMRFGMAEQKDFEIRSYGKPAKRELYVQYEESDWDFLQRWFERDGLYYWFEHDDAGEKLIVADDTRGSKPIPGDASLAYRDHANLVHGDDSISAWSGRKKRIVGAWCSRITTNETRHCPWWRRRTRIRPRDSGCTSRTASTSPMRTPASCSRRTAPSASSWTRRRCAAPRTARACGWVTASRCGITSAAIRTRSTC